MKFKVLDMCLVDAEFVKSALKKASWSIKGDFSNKKQLVNNRMANRIHLKVSINKYAKKLQLTELSVN